MLPSPPPPLNPPLCTIMQFACLLSDINSQVSSCAAHSNECVVAGINADRNDHREKWNTCMLLLQNI